MEFVHHAILMRVNLDAHKAIVLQVIVMFKFVPNCGC